MADSRRKEEKKSTQDALVIRKNSSKSATWNGLTLTFAEDVDQAIVQDDDELVLVGADVVALCPNIMDLEVANICYTAVMKYKAKFSIIYNYRKAGLYIVTASTDNEDVEDV